MLSGLSRDISILFLSLLATLGLWRRVRRWSAKKVSANSENVRRAGEWSPIDFKYPEFEAWRDFDLHNTRPIPYRPFRWGAYPIHMGIRDMSWESWIELDNHYLKMLEIRKARVVARGDKVVRTLPGAERAALEVCTELASYLAKRYPQVFRIHRVNDKGGLGEGDSIVGKNGGRIKIVEIIPTGDKWDLDLDDPMMVAGLLADDIAIMIEGSDGQYTLQAGSICIPGGWRLVDKIGLALKDIHLKGNVYKYKENLQFSMDKFFRRMTVDMAVARNNYNFQVESNLAWLNKHHGDEDLFDQLTKAPRADASESQWQRPSPTTDMSEVYFRSERQTLRRMPKTGCICFTIRTYFHPVTELVQEPGVPGRLAAAIRGWSDPVSHRKSKALYADTMLPWLDDLHRKQIEAGVVNAEDQISRYPF